MTAFNKSIFLPELEIIASANYFLKEKNTRIAYVISVDEVGRGCLAGDVVCGASIFKVIELTEDPLINELIAQQKNLSKAGDSKKITQLRREAFVESVASLLNLEISGGYSAIINRTNLNISALTKKASAHFLYDEQTAFTSPVIKMIQSDRGFSRSNTSIKLSTENLSFPTDLNLLDIHVNAASPKEIDDLGIFGAINLASSRAILACLQSVVDKAPSKTMDQIANSTLLIMDGNRELSIPSSIKIALQALVTKGDARLKSIGTSAIFAKVARDHEMATKYHELYPDYGFDTHKGYATKAHYEALKREGISSIHRKSFRLT